MFELKVSYLEIYNEQVRDLLSDKSTNLMIVEDPVRGVIVPDLNEFKVSSSDELASIIYIGNQRRTMAPTQANSVSSRSHAILIFSVEGRDRSRNIKEGVFYSKLQIIDLAGSERAATTDNRAQRMVEGANINRSLLALGNCINILSDKGKTGSFVPYRDSKLTRLLKDSLGGNTKTIMIACISPSFLAFEETINTLKYASRARNIKRKTTKNVKEVELHVSRYKEVIDSLKSEIESLRGQLKSQQHHHARQSVSPIRSPLQQQQNQQLTKSSMNNRSREPSSHSKSRKSSYIRPSISKTNQNNPKVTQNTHGHTTPVRLSHSYGKQPLGTQRQLTFNQNVKESMLENSDSFSIEQILPKKQNFGEIEDEINKIYNEKLKLENEILSDSKSNQRENGDKQNQKTQQELEEENYIERLSQNLISNFEEHWELKQSLADLEDLQNKNKESLNILRYEIQELENQNQSKFANFNQFLESQVGQLVLQKQNEIRILERNHQNNIKILNEMRVALDINLEQKQKLQDMLLQMHSSKRQILLENQIEMRNLKLEKTDLYLQNLQMKKINQIQQKEKEETDQKLIEMQKQLEIMQQELQNKDKIILESKKQLQIKEKEIQQIKGQDLQSSEIKQTQPVHHNHHKTDNIQQIYNNQSDMLANPYIQHNSTVKIDLNFAINEQSKVQGKNQNQSNVPNSARYEDFSSKNKLQQTTTINKKLILSGFFEDDFQGELEEQEMNHENKMNKIERILGENDANDQTQMDPLLEYGAGAPISTSVLKSKRQSQDTASIMNPSNTKTKKGYTPNNRYNATNEYISIENDDQQQDLKASIGSSLQMNFNIDGSLERELCSKNQNQPMLIQQFSHRETPVAQVNLFNINTAQTNKHTSETNIYQLPDSQLQTQDEREQIRLYQPKIQTSNQRYQNHQPDPNFSAYNMHKKNESISSQIIRGEQEVVDAKNDNSNYESRRDMKQSNNKKSNQKRSSKLNRYLSFNRKDGEEKQNSQNIQQNQSQNQIQIKVGNQADNLINKNKTLQEEKENSYPYKNLKHITDNTNGLKNQSNNSLDVYNTASADNRLSGLQNSGNKKYLNAFSPTKQHINHTIDLRQVQDLSQQQVSKEDINVFQIPNNKFEQRKYSQPVLSDQNNKNRDKSGGSHNQQLHKTPQNNNSRRPPSPSLNNLSSLSGGGISSYAQIRRQSKERQQQQQQQTQNKYQSSTSYQQQTPIQMSNSNQINPYTQRKPSLQNSNQNDRKSTGYNSHKIDLSNQNNSNKYKASATATISRYGPIKPTYSQNQIGPNGGGSFVSNGDGQNTNNNQQSQVNIPHSFGIGQTYFENFIKKKNSFITPNNNSNSINPQQMQLGNNIINNGPTRATVNHTFTNFSMNQNPINSAGNGGPTAVKVFNNTQSPLVQSQYSQSNSNMNSHRQLINTGASSTLQTTPSQQQHPTVIPSTLQLQQLEKQNDSVNKRNPKSNSINIQSLEELLIMNQAQANGFTSVNQNNQDKPPSTATKLTKDVNDLLNKQKAQLNKDKEKLQKNHNFFSNSFASTLNNVMNANQSISSNPGVLSATQQIQPSNPDSAVSHNASMNQPAQTERVYDTNKFASNCFLQTANQGPNHQQQNLNNGNLSNRTQSSSGVIVQATITNPNSTTNAGSNNQTKNFINNGICIPQHSNSTKLIHSQRYSNGNSQVQLQGTQNQQSISKNTFNHQSASTIHHSSNQMNPCVTNNTITLNALTNSSHNSNSHQNILQIDSNMSKVISNQPLVPDLPSLKFNQPYQNIHSYRERDRYQQNKLSLSGNGANSGSNSGRINGNQFNDNCSSGHINVFNDDELMIGVDERGVESPARKVYLLSESSDNALNILPM